MRDRRGRGGERLSGGGIALVSNRRDKGERL
ncbi:hypothetical protein A2U01_0071472, partial [Trifolium medium]|nr:hypothetical protein [Trifolium medium]